MTPKTRARLAAAGIYLLLTLLYFLPVLPDLARDLIGPAEDNMLFYWNLWWTGRTMGDPALSLTHTTHILHPEGQSLLMHSMSWLNCALAAGPGLVLPLPLIYNLLILSGFFFGALGMFLLAGRYVSGFLPRLLAGFLFAFTPFHTAQALHHLNIASIQFLPLFIYLHQRAREVPSPTRALAAGLGFAAAALTSWYFLVFLLVYLLTDTIITLAGQPRSLKPELKTLALILAAGGLLLAPLAVPMLQYFLENRAALTHQPLDPMNYYVADLAGLVRPSTYHPLWGGPELDFARPFTSNSWESAVFLGYTALVLAGLGLGVKAPHRRRLVIHLLVFLVLSLGTGLHVLGREVGPQILPYNLIKLIPGLNVARIPARMIIMAQLFLALLAARGLERVLTFRLPGLRSARPGLLAGAVLALCFLEFLALPQDHTPVRLPQAYQAVLQDRGTGVLDLPMDGYKLDRAYMLYQTGHDLPIAGGTLARLISQGLVPRIQKTHPRDLGPLLAKNRISHLVIHKAYFKAPVDRIFTPVMEKLYEDETQVVYRTGE